MVNILSLIEGLTDKDDKYAYECLKQLEAESADTEEVYDFFDIFANMIDSKNSYIRTRGMLLIAANAKWDIGNKIEKVIERYLEHIKDTKPITARQCIKTLPEIVKHKPGLKGRVLDALHGADISGYNENMGPLILKDIQKAIKEISRY